WPGGAARFLHGPPQSFRCALRSARSVQRARAPTSPPGALRRAPAPNGGSAGPPRRPTAVRAPRDRPPASGGWDPRAIRSAGAARGTATAGCCAVTAPNWPAATLLRFAPTTGRMRREPGSRLQSPRHRVVHGRIVAKPSSGCRVRRPARDLGGGRCARWAGELLTLREHEDFSVVFRTPAHPVNCRDRLVPTPRFGSNSCSTGDARREERIAPSTADAPPARRAALPGTAAPTPARTTPGAKGKQPAIDHVALRNNSCGKPRCGAIPERSKAFSAMCQSFCGKELPRKVKAPIQMDRAPHQLCRTTREKGLLQRAVRI